MLWGINKIFSDLRFSVKEVEKAAPSSEVKLHFNSVFAKMPLPCLILLPYPPFTVIEVNEAYLEISKLQREEIINKRLIDIGNHADAYREEELHASLERVLQTRAPDTLPIQSYSIVETKEINESIEECYWRYYHTPILNKEGKIEFILHCREDVTAFLPFKKRRIENSHTIQIPLQTTSENLPLTPAYHQTFASLTSIGVLRFNLEGECYYINPYVETLIGLSFSAIKSKLWYQLAQPSEQERLAEGWKQNNLSAKVFKVEFLVQLPNEQPRWIMIEMIPEIKAGVIQGYIGFAIDTTAYKRLEEKHTAYIADHQMRQKQFIDTMSHEFRNPLNGIYGSVHLLEGAIEELETLIKNASTEAINDGLRKDILRQCSQSKRIVQDIEACSKHQNAVLGDTLHLFNLESNNIELDIVTFDPKKLIQDAIDALKTKIEHKKLQLYLKLMHEEMTVEGDAKKLAQVFLNLLTQVVNSTLENGKITVSFTQPTIKEESAILTFCVKSDGFEVSDEEKTKMFDHFLPNSPKTFQRYGNSGLELTITKKLIELMGGKIEVESKKNRETKFTFTIQCKNVVKLEKRASSPLTFQFPLVKVTPENNNQYILVVEDNIINQRVLKLFLEGKGYKVEIANNGKEAVALFEKYTFALIIMDIEMPEMNGLQATQVIRSKENALNKLAIPILGLSSNTTQEQINKALACGMTEYLSKPFDKELLLQKLNLYLPSISLKMGSTVSAKLKHNSL